MRWTSRHIEVNRQLSDAISNLDEISKQAAGNCAGTGGDMSLYSISLFARATATVSLYIVGTTTSPVAYEAAFRRAVLSVPPVDQWLQALRLARRVNPQMRPAVGLQPRLQSLAPP